MVIVMGLKGGGDNGDDRDGGVSVTRLKRVSNVEESEG